MRVDIIYPVLPPVLNGIGDHTAHLARTLANQHGADVRILTAQTNWTPVPGVAIEQAFSLNHRHKIGKILRAVRRNPPDWLLLQFEQFSYGRWGLNPYVPLTLYRARKRLPHTRTAVMFHEDFVPANSWKNTVMSTWQRAQFWGLAHSSDRMFFSTEPWAAKYRRTFPRTPVHHLPVGSNIPKQRAVRARVRETLGVGEDSLLLGLFGTTHPSRLLGHVAYASSALDRTSIDFNILYIGPDGDTVTRVLENAAVIDLGTQPAADVSRYFSAMDLYLAPFKRGVSTRRGSFLTGLQHGVATVSTCGSESGAKLRAHNSSAFFLSPWKNRQAFADSVVELASNPEKRAEIAQTAESYFEGTYTWQVIADKFRRALEGQPKEPRAAFSSTTVE